MDEEPSPRCEVDWEEEDFIDEEDELDLWLEEDQDGDELDLLDDDDEEWLRTLAELDDERIEAELDGVSFPFEDQHDLDGEEEGYDPFAVLSYEELLEDELDELEGEYYDSDDYDDDWVLRQARRPRG